MVCMFGRSEAGAGSWFGGRGRKGWAPHPNAICSERGDHAIASPSIRVPGIKPVATMPSGRSCYWAAGWITRPRTGHRIAEMSSWAGLGCLI
jgi:hypothetical protein